jgi:thiamine-phosphate pyrophosphorylase
MKRKDLKDMYLGGICLVTDRKSCNLTAVEMAQIVLMAGIKWIQYRDKERSRLCFYRTALELRRLTRDFGAHLIINDYADIAAAIDADGVHLGQGDLPVKEARRVVGSNKKIGISTRSLIEAQWAEAEGADYIGFGPVMTTNTKDAGPPKGLGMLAEISSKVKIPVVAIGGVNLDNLNSMLSSGAQAVAVANCILSGDISYNAGGLLQRISCH